MLSLLESWANCYHHLPFNPEVNGTNEVLNDVNEILPLEEQPVEEKPTVEEPQNTNGKDDKNNIVKDGLKSLQIEGITLSKLYKLSTTVTLLYTLSNKSSNSLAKAFEISSFPLRLAPQNLL